MALLVVLFLVCLLVPIGVGVLAHRRRAELCGGPSAWAAAALRRGPVSGAVVYIVGMAVLTGGVLALGFAAKASQDSLDRPIYEWVHPRVHGNAFTSLNEKLTLIGNNPTTELVVLIAGIVLAAAFGRRWWFPVGVILISYYVEKYAQKFIGSELHRVDAPPGFGTFPSGGVARILAVYGPIVLLIILLNPRLSRSWRCGLWTGVVTAATVEAFTRVYLSKHWFTDTVGGLIFGGGQLVITIVAVLVAARALRAAPDPVGDGSRPAASLRR